MLTPQITPVSRYQKKFGTMDNPSSRPRNRKSVKNRTKLVKNAGAEPRDAGFSRAVRSSAGSVPRISPTNAAVA